MSSINSTFWDALTSFYDVTLIFQCCGHGYAFFINSPRIYQPNSLQQWSGHLPLMAAPIDHWHQEAFEKQKDFSKMSCQFRQWTVLKAGGIQFQGVRVQRFKRKHCQSWESLPEKWSENSLSIKSRWVSGMPPQIPASSMVPPQVAGQGNMPAGIDSAAAMMQGGVANTGPGVNPKAQVGQVRPS